MPNSPTSTFAGELVPIIEDVWRHTQKLQHDLPDVVVTLGGGRRGATMRYGHFSEEAWKVNDNAAHELFVGGEGLERGAEPVLCTVLHEAAHGLATARGIRDTSRGGRYHNKRFKELAEQTGVTVLNTVDGQKCRMGWTGDHALSPAAGAAYADELTRLDAVLRGYRLDRVQKRKTNNNGYACACRCDPERRIRVSIAVYGQGPIICGLCTSDFVAED